MAKQIDKSMLIHEIIEVDPGNAAILMAAGMHCVGCPSAAMESLEEACMVHGMNCDEVIADIAGMKLAVDAQLAHAARDQLRVLRAEIKNNKFLVHAIMII
jgi:hybrid cluster-associated redox disulfide protein